jgi:hypothetical protein
MPRSVMAAYGNKKTVHSVYGTADIMTQFVVHGLPVAMQSILRWMNFSP